MKRILILLGLSLACVSQAGAIELYQLGDVGEECDNRGASANERTWCEDTGGSSPSWRQRQADELAAKLAAIKRSFATPFGGLFKPSAEID